MPRLYSDGHAIAQSLARRFAPPPERTGSLVPNRCQHRRYPLLNGSIVTVGKGCQTFTVPAKNGRAAGAERRNYTGGQEERLPPRPDGR